ncbi:ABC transporter ATP-binding protein [Microbispora hainanensis]|uniref:ABC transporter ATP-binding protein n=1 Tax=Microbispora hainanensis TaxID=568844 RepID=A0A544Z2N8_9ACTN|nr:ABC transporter ATP-binding protein [Microbispora hainanensis]TQS23316.1 ABC transporter ATP-binding protein [Microbispora hainanensis]
MDRTSSSEAVRLSEVRRVYGSGAHVVTALRGVSAVFPTGSFTAIMGPSGSGKSTLLQCASGLDRPDGGQVVIGGVDLGGLSERRLTELRRDRVGFVFQSFNLVESLNAAQNISLPVLLSGHRPAPGHVEELLRTVGLADRARHRPAELSGGQQQRVAIARALVTRPEVLFADEPTGALDSRTGREVLRLLRQLVDERGDTVVMVTHDPLAASHADRVLFLSDGALVGELWSPSPATVAARLAALEDTAYEDVP